MVTKVNITAAEFDRRRDRMRSRWAELIELLKAGKVDDAFNVPLSAEDNTGEGRDRARQSIYAIARHHGIRVSLFSAEDAIQVMKTGEFDPSQTA